MPIESTLPAGAFLLDALHALLAEGYDSACLALTGGGLGAFAYVMPAKSPDDDHAAFYSATFRPAGETRFETGAVTVGFRDGQPFFHCHAIWTEADGRRGCGHVLPDETVIASPIQVRGAGIIGARFEVHPDRETGYSLLAPVATGRAQPPGARRAIALRWGGTPTPISQLRSGGIDMLTLSGLILSILVPAASINGVGFAFPDYATVWKAMDGKLGDYIGLAVIAAVPWISIGFL